MNQSTQESEMGRRQVVHLSKVRKNSFGGTTYGTLCNRLRTLPDGMNITTEYKDVTCKFCLKALEDA